MLRQVQDSRDPMNSVGLGAISFAPLEADDILQIDIGPGRKILYTQPMLTPSKLHQFCEREPLRPSLISKTSFRTNSGSAHRDWGLHFHVCRRPEPVAHLLQVCH